jgi:predicted nucleotidyltransferase
MDNLNKIEKVFFEDSYKEYHIRHLARLTKLNPNTIINLIKKIKYLDINKDKTTNRVTIKPITQDPKFLLKKKFYNIRKISDSGLISFLNDELSLPTIILFGSYAKAENHPESDIDIFIISDEKKKINLYKFENKLKTEIQVFHHTKKDFKKIKQNNTELINNVINGYVLSGYFEVL